MKNSYLTFDFVFKRGFSPTDHSFNSGRWTFEKGNMKITKDWHGWDFYYKDREVCGEISNEKELDELLRKYSNLNRKEKILKIIQ